MRSQLRPHTISRMSQMSDALLAHYGAYYEHADPRWRELGAVDKADNITRLCSDVPHQRVVDIGAGEGAIIRRLAAQGFADSYTALEVSESGIDRIKATPIPALSAAILFDGYTIPFDFGTFDLAILSHVVEHVEHPRQLLSEAARVARYVFVEVPLEQTSRMSADYKWTSTGHINFYSPKTIRRLVQTCGLTVLEQRVTLPSHAAHTFKRRARGSVAYALKYIALKIAPPLAPSLFVYHSALLCRAPDVSVRS